MATPQKIMGELFGLALGRFLVRIKNLVGPACFFFYLPLALTFRPDLVAPDERRVAAHQDIGQVRLGRPARTHAAAAARLKGRENGRECWIELSFGDTASNTYSHSNST